MELVENDLSANIFLKQYNYKRNSTWALPSTSSFFRARSDLHNDLNKLKTDLNHVKNLLNHLEIVSWRRHTNYTNPSGNVVPNIHKLIHPELGTQAWCKFHELLSYGNVIELPCGMDTLGTVHLCEAPGSFICSLNHYLKSRFEFLDHKWIANTLNPYYEGNSNSSCIVDDRLLCRTFNSWCLGKDNTGDIFSKGLFNFNTILVVFAF